jgi:hypothetical protein
MLGYLYIHAQGENALSYSHLGHFFAQKRLLEQLYPVSCDEYSLEVQDEITLLYSQMEADLDQLSNIGKAICTFLIQTQKGLTECVYRVHATQEPKTMYDMESIGKETVMLEK